MERQKMFKITEEQRNSLLNYLKRRPWDESVQLMTMLLSLKPEENKKDKPEKVVM
jgi:ribosomal protein S15P/S13E